MTTEEDFQRMLDEDPSDYMTRLVFADWLEERGDPRAEGYRALGALRRNFIARNSRTVWVGSMGNPGLAYELRTNPAWDYRDTLIPGDWFELIPFTEPDWKRNYWRPFDSRREAEDAAALAFAKLSAERRAELLTVKAVPV